MDKRPDNPKCEQARMITGIIGVMINTMREAKAPLSGY